MTNPIDDRIEAKLISKIAHYRLNIRTQFRNRHNVMWPELTYRVIMGDIKNLRIWLRIAELIDAGQDRVPNKSKTPYAIYPAYLAKQLSI